MSKQLVKEAQLDGYFGPIEISTENLQNRLAEQSFHGDSLKMICQLINSYAGQNRPTTSDGYYWFWAQNFKGKTGFINILIPWSQDWGRKDNCQSDRSIAVYTQGEVSEQEIMEILEQFSNAVVTFFSQEN